MKYLVAIAFSLLSTKALANPVSVEIVPGPQGCKGALVHNLSGRNLSVTIKYTYVGIDSYGNQAYHTATTQGSHDTSSGARSAGDGYGFRYGLSPGQTYFIGYLSSGPVSCDKPYTVKTSYTFLDLDTQNAQTQRAIDAEDAQHRQASNAFFDQLAQREREKAEQRRKEYEEFKVRRDARAEENRRKAEAAAANPCLQLGQYCSRGGANGIKASPSSMQNNSGSTSRSDEQARARQAIADFAQRQAQEQQQLDIQRQQAEQAKVQAKAQAERDALRRHAEWHDQYVADMQARNRAAAAAQQQAERERQRLLAEQRAAEEQRRQEQWQQQVNMTSSLFQGAIQSSEKALAASRKKLGQTTNNYNEESDVLNAILEQAKTAAGRK